MIKLTAAQDALIEGGVTLAAGAGATALTATYQGLSSGHVNLQTLGYFLFASFTTALIKSLITYVPGHIQQELQAIKDTQAQLLMGSTGSAAMISRPLGGEKGVGG